MYQALDEIKLQTIDFDWIKNNTKISHLKRAIKLIQHDGNYFTELKDACYKRLQQLDPSLKRIQINNNVSNDTKYTIDKELQQWEQSVNKKTQNKIIFQKNLQDTQSYFMKDQKPKELSKQAQRQRNKGNEAIKSKDFDQAIGYYTKSLSYDPSMYQSYGNRALAYLKKKQYQKCLDDCQNALRLNSKYTKAYHRRAKAYLGMKNRVQAYKALQQVLKIEPQNGQVNGQARQLWQQMNQDQKIVLGGGKVQDKGSQFKKITIEEQSDQDD